MWGPPRGLRGAQGLAERGWQCEPRGWAGEYFGVQRWGCCGGRAPVMLQPHPGRGGDRAGVCSPYPAAQGSPNPPQDTRLGVGWAVPASALGTNPRFFFRGGTEGSRPAVLGLAPGTADPHEGRSPKAQRGRRCRAGGAGGRSSPGPTRGGGVGTDPRGSARWPGPRGTKQHRETESGGIGGADFVVWSRGPKTPSFARKTSAGSGWEQPGRNRSEQNRIEPCPTARSGPAPGFWGAFGGQSGVCVCVYVCVCGYRGAYGRIGVRIGAHMCVSVCLRVRV